MEWKNQTVIRRCQLRLARTFLLGRKRRTLRAALVAWRDGRRGRAQVARALSRVARAFDNALRRKSLRRLAASARWQEHKEAVSIGGQGRETYAHLYVLFNIYIEAYDKVRRPRYILVSTTNRGLFRD